MLSGKQELNVSNPRLRLTRLDSGRRYGFVVKSSNGRNTKGRVIIAQPGLPIPQRTLEEERKAACESIEKLLDLSLASAIIESEN